jgi:hypothetical protein
MRIVVLDGQALNPGDLSWKRLAPAPSTIGRRTRKRSPGPQIEKFW